MIEHNWKNKNVLVVGASSGMGKSIAQYLNSLGANIFLVGRNEERLQGVKELLKGSANDYLTYDLEDVENIGTIFSTTQKKGYKFDAFVFSAGIDCGMPIKVNNVQKDREMLNINTVSFLELVKYITKKKNCTENLSIVAISSIVTRILNPGSAIYASSKASLDTIVKVAAKEFVQRKIRVNCISPALTDTPLITSRKESGGIYADNGIHLQKLGYIEPMQIAYLTEFLLSEKAKYITAANIEVNAAWNYE